MSIIQDEPRVSQTPSASEFASSPPPGRRPAFNRAWAAAAGLIVLLAVLVAGALSLAARQSQADPQVAAIQQVIQRADDEQAQALASQNPSVMSDTAMASYYRQLVQINQQLQAQGVTGIKLTNLSWGPINVTGTTATATASETWVTTFSDGTTAESTDTNVYTLTQQNGSWLIEADQQAAATPAAGQSATPAAPQPPLPAVPASTATSHNWSGYAATSGSFTGVSGTWTVPQPSTATATAGVGATWVGIGGVTSRDLIQAGTQDVVSGGQDQFQAWIEMLPQASQQVPLAVAPGDSVSVSITESAAGSGVWQIVMKNNTSGQSYQTTVQYTSSQSSAEWIQEAPSTQGGIAPLDNFGTLSFSAAAATDNGQTVDLAQAEAQPITMLNAANQALAVPSGIGSDGASFSVTRTTASATTGPGSSLGRRPGGAQPSPGR